MLEQLGWVVVEFGFYYNWFLHLQNVLIGNSTELQHWSWSHLSSFAYILMVRAKDMGVKLVFIIAT